MNNKLFEIVCAKDENAARSAAAKIFNECNIEEFEKLCEKMEFLFDFVRDNVLKRFSLAVNSSNFKNIFKFFDCYSPYFDDFFAATLAKYADEDLTDEVAEILINGNTFQKAYAASYFKKIPDTVAKEDLENNLSTDFEPLFWNCAEALGKMKDETLYEKYKTDLMSEDEFKKLNAVKFLVAYGNKNAADYLINSITDSGMSENIAGEIVALISPIEAFKKDFKQGAILFNNLINGFGEILPLENVFYYEIYDVIQLLFSNIQKSEAVLLLFNLKNKFDTLTQNDEYIFDLDKNTKNEIIEIKNLLFSKGKDFWSGIKDNLCPLIKENNPFLQTVLEVIKEEKFNDFVSEVAELTNSGNETVICEAASVLKALDSLALIDKSKLNFKNENLKAIFEQLYV